MRSCETLPQKELAVAQKKPLHWHGSCRKYNLPEFTGLSLVSGRKEPSLLRTLLSLAGYKNDIGSRP